MYINSPKKKFDFGPYKGKTFEYVMQHDPAYIENCMLNLSDFSIEVNVLKQVKKAKKIKYKFSDDAIFKNENNLNGDNDFFEEEDDDDFKFDVQSKKEYQRDFFEEEEDDEL